MRVLIAEDELILAMLVEDILISLGHEPVGPAHSVKEAMEFVGQCDFAILDLNLMDGESYAVADALRAKGVPFCFSSGHGCVDYLEARTLKKPFGANEIHRALEPYVK